MSTANTPDKTKLLDRLSSFLSKYRTVLVVILVVAAVGVVALFVVLEIADNRREAALEQVEDLQSSYGDWLILDDEEQVAQFASLEEEINALLTDYSRGYPRLRPLFTYAQALEQLERWDDARTRYLEVAEVFPESYLAPIALTLAAVASENAGNPEEALETLTRLVDTYDSDVSEVPRALFSIGRINETLDNILLAAESYNRLIDEHPGSSWTNLARARIISLTVEGRIGS